ncbi:uncharacterized protein EAF02_005574 [Botrytis sinoallii]|uniref:uncharacterized protein n=1 Tax=Botrytis sinoallii TaxID=1463999 RepID=UPI00190014C9|nr:uncharacterized protein EAF02_005574 [Botrytis sinoallii]KAF7883654.1 hypothetical protein EAF02_005574 [Botrytis sinoallii]
MRSSQVRGVRDTQCALKPEERNPDFSFPQCHEESWFPSHQKTSPSPINPTSYRSQFVGDIFPSAHEYYHVQKQQEQQQRQVSKRAPPSPTVSLISTYGQTPWVRRLICGRNRIIVVETIEQLREAIWDRQYGLNASHLFLNRHLRRSPAVKKEGAA